uniref:LRAT domain-containing protein n=1 Tax=Crocodylus porosus TaxID=8502 RepID=A0A7M4FEM2_CROPO
PEAPIPPKPGNLFKIYCTCYQHWAIYVGYGYVVHLTLQGEAAEAVFSSLFSVTTGRAVVSWDLLLTMPATDPYQVNNLHDGHLSLWPHQDIVHEAEAQLGLVLPCCNITKNCKHFITQLRYGVPISNQVRDVVIVGLPSLTLVGGVLVRLLVKKMLSESRNMEK